MPLTLDKLKQTVKGFQDKKDDRNSDWPRVSFLPEGNHKVRFITDPSDEAFIQYGSYGYFGRGIRDPYEHKEELPEGFENQLQEIYKEKFVPRNKWSFGRKDNTLAYVYLYDTDAKSDNWEPGNLYVIIGNSKFAESYVNFLSSLAKEAPEEIMKTLNPASQGVILDLRFKFGKDGYCNIGAAFPTKMADPIDLKDHVYIDLQKAYIKPGFNQEKYDALVKYYLEQAAKLDGTPLPASEDGKAAEGAESNKTNPEIPDQPAQAQSRPMIPMKEESSHSTKSESNPPFDPPYTNSESAGNSEANQQQNAAPSQSNNVWAQFRKTTGS